MHLPKLRRIIFNQQLVYLAMNENELQTLLEGLKWTFAKTMPENPHFWSARKDWKDDAAFEAAVVHIRKFATREKFKKSWYMVFYAGGWKYWTMGAPIAITTIINRAEVGANERVRQHSLDIPDVTLE